MLRAPPSRLEAVVAHVEDVVVVEIDGQRHTVRNVVRRAVGSSVSGDIDAVVPVRDVVVRDDMPLAVDFDRVLGCEQFRIAGKLRPWRSGPAHHLVGIVPADEDVVGDVEVLRSGPVGLHGAADVVELRVLQREAARSGDVLMPSRNATLVLRNVMPSK